MPTTQPPQHLDARLADAPPGHGFRFEQDREWLVLRIAGGSFVAAIGLLGAAAAFVAMAGWFIQHTRGAGNPPDRQATGELIVVLCAAPFVAIALAGAVLGLPRDSGVAFSASEARITPHVGLLRRHKYVPLAECRRLRILERQPPSSIKEGAAQSSCLGRLAFDVNHRTIHFAPGLSNAEAREIFQFLVRTVPRFAQSHELS